MEQLLYYKYSDYLKQKYGEKVYKLPINLPITCPNRINGSGCVFCAGIGTGFEACTEEVPVVDQLNANKKLVTKKYNAHKYIAYFQNYTNTFMPLDDFRKYLTAAMEIDNVVEISISTRPDCISEEYLRVMKDISTEYKCAINIELGLQTVNYHTLRKICRGHGLAEYLDAVYQIREFGFTVCTHVILNLPGDTIEDAVETARIISAVKTDIVKVHSLYIAKNTILCEWYENGTITLCEKEEYLQRLISFLEYLNPNIAVERLFSRIPEKDAVFSNWGISWWKLHDETMDRMQKNGTYQGRHFNYLRGSALRKIPI